MKTEKKEYVKIIKLNQETKRVFSGGGTSELDFQTNRKTIECVASIRFLYPWKETESQVSLA